MTVTMTETEGESEGETLLEEPVLDPEIEIQLQQQEEKDTIDIDILGRQYKPFDVVQWIQCTNSDCNKWFKNNDILNKHYVKYHPTTKLSNLTR